MLGALTTPLPAAELPATSDPDPLDLAALDLDALMKIEVPTVYGASRFSQKANRAPAAVTVLTARDIEHFGYRNLGEALGAIPGLYVSNDRNYSYLGVRGFLRPGDYNSRVLMLVDGHRINDNLYDSFYLGADGIVDLDLIERIEFIPGPGSTLYGSNALLGVVHVVTKSGAAINGLQASAEAGSLDTYSGRLTFGQRFQNDLDLVASASLYDSAGHSALYYPEFDNPEDGDGWARRLDDEQAYRFSARASLGGFTLTGAFNQRDKTVPTASYGTVFNDGREATRDTRAYLDLAFDRELDDDSRLLGRVFYDRYHYRGTYPYADDSGPGGVILNRDRSAGEWAGAEIQYNRTLADRHVLIAGADYRENLRQFQSNTDDDPPAVYLDDEHGSRNVGAFAQGDIALLQDLHLIAGLSYDHYSSFGDSVNPRAALIYHPWSSTTFKALYGRAFRAPNDFEQHYLSASNFRASDQLGPETIDTYELVWEQRLAPAHRFRLSAYRYTIDDLISQTVDPDDGSIFYANLDRALSHGVELAWESHLGHGIIAQASYALQRAEDCTTGAELSNSPRHLARLHLLAPIHRQKLFAGLEVRYRGESRTLLGNTADDFALVNLTLFGRELLPGLDASATLYNLFDTRYAIPGAADHRQDTIPQDGLGFRLKLTYRF